MLFSPCLCFGLPHPIPLLELMGSPVGAGGAGYPPVPLVTAHRAQLWPEDTADGARGSPAGAGLGWALNPTWHLFLLLLPYVGIAPPVSISRFPVAQGWFGNTSSVVEGAFVTGS